MVWVLNDTHAGVARFVTKEEYRGKGIGRNVFNAALQYLGDRNTGLCAYVGSQGLYSKFGFNLASYGIAHILGTADQEEVDKLPNSSTNCSVVPLIDVNIEDILCYDTSRHKVKRKEFLLEWLSPNRSQSVVALNQNSQIQGYASLWPADLGYRIQPLYADSVNVARILLKHVIRLIPRDVKFELFIIMENVQAVELWNSILEDDYRTNGVNRIATQMFTKAVVPVQKEKVYAVLDADCSFA